ncbi:MAG: PAS domain-containing protein [Bacteriovoracaceae bacterium]
MNNLLNILESLGEDFEDSFVVADINQEDMPLVYINSAFVSLTGYSKEEILGLNCRFLQGPTTNKEAVKNLRESIRNKESCYVDLLNHKKDGSVFWNRLVLFTVGYSAENPRYYVGIQQKVSDDSKVKSDFDSNVKDKEIIHNVVNPFDKILSAKRSMNYLSLESPDLQQDQMIEMTKEIALEVQKINKYIKSQ